MLLGLQLFAASQCSPIDLIGETSGFITETAQNRYLCTARNFKPVAFDTHVTFKDLRVIEHNSGYIKPVADNATSEGRSLNRRAEIRFTEEGDAPEEYDFGVSEDDFGDFDLEGLDSGDSATDTGATLEGVGDLEVPEEIEMPDFEDELDSLDEPEE